MINANACLRFLAGASPNLDEAREGLHAIARWTAGERGDGADSIPGAQGAGREGRLDVNRVILEVVALAEGETRWPRKSRTELRQSPACGAIGSVQQIVLSLLLNGWAMHTVVGRPRELVISTHREAADRIRVAVQDSGSGLDPQLANRIFEAFYTTKSGGMGMGLSISRTIIERQGGRLWAVPNDGPGATFHFTV